MKVRLSQLRQLIREEFETAYNDYEASQDNIMRRLRQVTGDEIKSRYPKFHQAIADAYHKVEDHDGLLDTKWFVMKTTFNNDTPYALLPSGEERVVFWNTNTDRLETEDEEELNYALHRFSDKTSTF